MNYIQEATAFNSGNNFIPVSSRYALPNQKSDVSVFLLSNSFEYDIDMIKGMPAPRIHFKNFILPSSINDRLGAKPFKYTMSNTDYSNKIKYLSGQKMIPQLSVINPPYPKEIKNNVYVSISDLIKATNVVLRQLSIQYIKDNIFTMFDRFMNNLNFSKQRVLIIDTKRFEICGTPSDTSYKNDIINALLTAYVLNPDKAKRLNWTFIFRHDVDYKFNLSSFEKRDIERMKKMLSSIGTKHEVFSDKDIDSFMDPVESTIDNEISDLEKATDELPDIDENDDDIDMKRLSTMNKSATTDIKNTLNTLASQAGQTETDNRKRDTLYDSKTFAINAELMKRINPASDVVNRYNSISNQLKSGGDNPVEDNIIDTASKSLNNDRVPVNMTSVMNTVSSPREQSIRANIGQLKLDDSKVKALSSISDVPKPPPIRPLKITSTNPAALLGSSFANINKEYENKLLDSDIVSTFMNLGNLPGGYDVTDIDVTDISNVTSLVHNWKVTLKHKTSGKSSVINIRVPKVMNGRFYNNGVWYNIGKQDFPIPILKIDKKTVMLTSNYNKITVERYDTRSLVDISMFVKTVLTVSDKSGKNPYITNGSSVNTNSIFVSTIEYDEYAKRWLSFINKDAGCEVVFNRQQCLKKYGFVSVNANEFCCGMINKVPIVLNTESGLTRDGYTLTDTMLATLPPNLQEFYKKAKPGKLSMYAQITIGEKVPLGVAICAWEGMTNLLKKSGCKYQYVDKTFTNPKFFVIPFKDKCLAIENTVSNQLIFNGFYRINTKGYQTSDFETPIMDSNSVFVDIFNQLFFKQFSQLTPFITYFNFFVDVITKDVCEHYNLPNDISGMLIYAAKMLADNNFTSEHNASLYRIRSCEIIPAIIHYELAVAISKHSNVLGSQSKGNKLIVNPNSVIINLMQQPNVSTASALSPMIELHDKEGITKKGWRGINNDRAYSVSKRSYDETMIGKLAMSSPNSANIGINRQLVIDPKIESVRGYTSVEDANTEYNDFNLASFSELLTPGTITRDDSIRIAIGTAQTDHIIATDVAQPVLISNGIDEIVPSYLSEEFAYVAEDDGVVVDINDDYIIIQYKKDNRKKAVNINHKYSFNTGSGFYVDNKLKTDLKVNDRFKKNEIIAYHENYFSKDSTGIVRLNIGPMAKVAFTGLYSTYEDAGLMTSKMSKMLGTKLSMMQDKILSVTDDIEKIVQIGDEVEISDPLIVFGLGDTGDKSVDNFLKSFIDKDSSSVLDSAKRVVKSKHAGRVVDVRMYTNKPLDRLSPSLYKLFSDYYKRNIEKRKILDRHDKSDSVYKLDTLYSLPTGPIKSPTLKGRTCDVLIEIYIEHGDEVSIGDKIAVYGASKQVISEMVPEGQEPYAETAPDEEVSIFVAPSCVLKRMIPSLMITASGNKVLLNLKKQIGEIWNSQ